MPALFELVRREHQTTVQYNDSTVALTLRPYTIAELETVMAAQREAGQTTFTPTLEFLSAVIVGWDITAEADGPPLPVDVSTLRQFPPALIHALEQAVSDVQTLGKS